MHFSALSTLAVLAAFAYAQIPPSFTPSANLQLGVAYGNTKVSPGQQLDINVPASAPTVGLNSTPTAANSTRWIIMMIDPDAPTPQNASSAQILHWMATDFHAPTVLSSNTTFPATLTNSTPAVIPYRRPSPPVTSSAHRYIQYLFLQPANFSIPASFSGFSNTNRSMFNLSRFIREAGLAAPAAANYFLCANMTGNATATTTSVVGGGGGAVPTATASRPAGFTGAAVNVQEGLWSAGVVGAVGVVAAFVL